MASYAYDGQGRRKLKTVGGTNTVYVTDADDREVLEYGPGTGAIGRWYAYGLGSNAVLSQTNVAAGTRSTFIPDVQGSILGTLDSGSGGLTPTAYLAFGENTANYSGTFRYTGQRIDPETGGSTSQPSGLYYYRARMYSPTWGRFLQADSVSNAGGGNLYAYTDNDPLNQTDPSGNCPACIGAVIGFGVDLAAQIYRAHANNQPFQYDFTRGLIATGVGAATAGASAFISTGAEVGGSALAQAVGSSLAQRAVSNAVVGVVAGAGQTAALNNIDNQNGSYTTSALLGGTLGAAGSVAGDLISGIGSTPGIVPGNGISVGQANKLNNIFGTSGVSPTTVSPTLTTLGVATGAAIGDLSGFSGK